MFEDVRHERSITLLLSLTEEGILRQAGFADQEVIVKKTLLLRKYTVNEG